MSYLETLFRRPAQKAATGIGAAMMTHGLPVSILGNDPAQRARQAMMVGRSDIHIRAAERAIASRIASVGWKLEDADDAPITDESPEQARVIRDLFMHPYTPQPGDGIVATPKTFADLRAITIRHTGLVGYGFWYLVGIDALAGLPAELLYINPARMTPATDKSGNLIGWVMDADQGGNGTPFTTEEIVVFNLEPPDYGFLSAGLVETALAKADVLRLGNQHSAYVLSAGGRMPGIYHPPTGEAIPEDVYLTLTRDLRSIVEMPDAAKRSMVLRGPIEFTATAKDPGDMQLLEIMAQSRDDIFSLWGVPKSQVGYERPSSIGSSSDDYDAEVFYKNGWGPRLEMFEETVQREIVDRYQKVGIVQELEFEVPEFDDDAALYDMAQKSIAVPMRASERRGMLGLPPFGDPALDDAIWLPINMVMADIAPPGEGDAMKARLESNQSVVRLRKDLAAFLKEQAERIGKRIESKATHLQRKPKDESTWWDQEAEDAKLLKVLQPHIVAFAEASGDRAASKVRGKASLPDTFRDVLAKLTLDRLAKRVTLINDTTRKRIANFILDAVADEVPMFEVGQGLRGMVKPLPDDATGNALRAKLGDFGSELRAETIARTEMRVAQNAATIDSFSELGIEQVQALDGDDDDLCNGRDGKVVDMATAEEWMNTEHPNGTLDFAPVVGAGKADTVVPSQRYGEPTMVLSPTINMPAPHVDVHVPEIKVPDIKVPDIVMPDFPAFPEMPAFPDIPAPVVHVSPPEVKVTVPDFPDIPAPIVNVEAPKEKASTETQPVYVVNMPKPRKTVVERGVDGRVTGARQVEQ